MAQIDKTKDATKDICWGRGDSDPRVFTVLQSDGVTVEDVSGWTFTLTVNSEKDPADQVNEQFSLTGALVTDGTDGQVAFTPTTGETDVAPGKYFYDIERKIGGTSVKTLIKAVCLIVQDVTKA